MRKYGIIVVFVIFIVLFGFSKFNPLISTVGYEEVKLIKINDNNIIVRNMIGDYKVYTDKIVIPFLVVDHKYQIEYEKNYYTSPHLKHIEPIE